MHLFLISLIVRLGIGCVCAESEGSSLVHVVSAILESFFLNY